MPVIIKDMDMPESCLFCPMILDEGTCPLIPIKDYDDEIVAYQKVDTFSTKRHWKCPLREAKQ